MTRGEISPRLSGFTIGTREEIRKVREKKKLRATNSISRSDNSINSAGPADMQEQYEFCPLSTDTATDNTRTIKSESARLESAHCAWSVKARRRKPKTEKRIVETMEENVTRALCFIFGNIARGLFKNKAARFTSLDMPNTRTVDCANSYVDCNSCKMKDRCYQNC